MLLFPGTALSQYDCQGPVVLTDNTTDSYVLNLASFESHYSFMCGNPMVGPDVVFVADGYNTNLVLKLTNVGPTATSIRVVIKKVCSESAPCDAAFLNVPLDPGMFLGIDVNVAEPLYVFLVGASFPTAIPINFAYSMGSAVSVEQTSWGSIKQMYDFDD
jgi:hypothetical protein